MYARSLEGAFAAAAAGIQEGRTASAAALPGGWDGSEMPWAGSGTFTVAPGTVPAPVAGRRVVDVLVRVEDAIPLDPAIVADTVMGILNDPRGWGAVDGVTFARTAEDAVADIVLTVASPATTEVLCGELPTRGYTSCGRGRPVNINGARWVHGSPAFMEAGGTIEEYQRYVINHEVGHSLGHPHEVCGGAGRLAPVMTQQTLTVGACTPNGWPAP